MNPRVSIIVAVYNAEKTLPRCLDSLINQTLKEIEILLVNDGSTDASGDKWLTQLYGDYMTPPPPEQQKSRHGISAYWK